jgi:hypothetical protein
MTHQQTMCGLLALGFVLSACGVEDKVTPTEAEGGENGEGGEDGGEGPDYSGSGNNSGGMDMEDPEAMVEPTYPTAHPRIYINANRARLQASLTANTAAAARLKASVDSWVNGADIWGFQVWTGALLGQLTGDPKYCTKAVAAVNAQVASEEALIASGQKPYVAGNSYLEIGGIVGDLALTYDWCFDVVTPAQKTRWLAYANQAVWNVWNPTQAKWGGKSWPWTGWSTNNPSDNYYYSFLRATMTLGLAAMNEDATATGWIAQFRDVKILGQLVPTFDHDLRGGGSREGTAYGVSMRGLFHLYDLWYATTGEKLQAKTKHARQSMRVGMHQIVPTLDRFVPTGDQPRDKNAEFYDYQRAFLTELIDMYPNDVVAGRAKSLLAASTVPQMSRPENLVYDFLYDNDGVTATPLDQMAVDYYASGIGQVYSRSSWGDKQATYINFTAGAYTESHAHQDQGSLMIYKGAWLAGDGVFGSSNGIIQDTTSHSIVRVNSGGAVVKQQVNTTSTLVALHRGADWLYAASDTTPAFNSSTVSKMQRELVYLKPNVVVVYDRVATAGGTTQTWQLATSVAPAISGLSATITNGGHTLKVQRLAPASGSSAATSMAGQAASGGSYVGGYRLDTPVAGGDVRYLHVLSLDGAVATATASGDSSVTIALTGGQTATVTFDRDNPGATLTWNGTTTTLAAGIDDIPE